MSSKNDRDGEIKTYIIRGNNFDVLSEIERFLKQNKKPGEDIVHTYKIVPQLYVRLYEDTVKELERLYKGKIEIEENFPIRALEDKKMFGDLK